VAKSRCAATAVLLLALAGCSSDPTPKANPSGTATSATATPSGAAPSASATTTTSASARPTTGGATAAPSSKVTTSARPGGPSPSASPTYTRDTLKLSVKPCVQPGQTQRLSFRLRPNMQVVVNTRYPDNKDGQVHGGYSYGRRTDAKGEFVLTWVLDPTTPTGSARTLVGAVDGAGTANGYVDWNVARRC
jgi:hypothetical protein